jgi:hypothetical protein
MSFRIHEAHQESLFSYLKRTKRLLREVSTERPISNTEIMSAIDGKRTPFALLNSHVFVGNVRDVTLLKRKYLLTSDNSFIAEGLTHSDYFITWEGFDASGLGKGRSWVEREDTISFDEVDPIKFEEECIFLGGDTIFEPNFAHWFFEHLLKLRAFQLAGVDLSLPILVSARLPERFLEWGNSLIGRSLNWRLLDITNPITFKSMYISSCPAYRTKFGRKPTLWAEGFDYLSSSLKSKVGNLGNLSVPPDQVLFLSRASAKWRRAVNEEDLFEVARKNLGAVHVNMENLSLYDQVKLIHGARAIICFAGADGPIVNFCNARAKVLEIAAPNHAALYTCAVFCALHRLSYARVFGSHHSGSLLGPHPLDIDYEVDLKQYCEAIELMSR